MNFDKFGFDPRLLRSLTRAGFLMPTPVQSASIPAVLSGRDVVCSAQTGTGKTAVFVLPILQKLLTGPRSRTRALILTPTRELAEQIHETIRNFGEGTKIRSATIYGGVGAAPQIQALEKGVEILVACPGRLLDHIEHRRTRFNELELLVLDEADRMLDMGFLPSVRRILKHLPNKRQTLLFSATFPLEIEKLAAETLDHPQRIAVGLSRPAHTVSHALFPVAPHLKTPLLMSLLKQTDTRSVLIFTRTKHRAQRLAQQIERSGYKVTSLHSDRSQSQRQSALNGFREGAYQIMVATDIAARGLDVETISHVINFDMPDTADAYLHRIGRTGRAERAGDAFTLSTPEDEDMIKTLEKIMNRPLPRETLADFEYAAPAHVHHTPAARPPHPLHPPRSGGWKPRMEHAPRRGKIRYPHQKKYKG
jgi:ATP-dependent RNA helicase RhlE